MSKHTRLVRSLLMLPISAGTLLFAISGPGPARAVLTVQQEGQVEVLPASKIATSTEPLRGMPPAPVSLGGVREKKRIRLNL